MSVYIKGIGTISPQRSFDRSTLKEGFTSFQGNRLKCVEPDYSLFVDARQIRRMSRVIKMGVASSMMAMKDAGIEKPDAVIVGTALGCLEDTASFLSKMVEYKEDMLSPTAFIHSTHNTIASQIALLFGCKGYNSTYVHRNISFESALIDAVLLMEEGTVNNVLVGGIDELTDTSFTILDRLGHFKPPENITLENLYEKKTKGAVGGEGSAFFTLANKADSNCYAEIKAVRTLSFPSPETVSQKVAALLAENGIDKPDIIIAGFNGDTEDDKATKALVNTLFVQNRNVLRYKHLCGEYATSTGFALWLASLIIKGGGVPEAFGYHPKPEKIPRNILIYNQYKRTHHSFMLLSSC